MFVMNVANGRGNADLQLPATGLRSTNQVGVPITLGVPSTAWQPWWPDLMIENQQVIPSGSVFQNPCN